MRELTEEERTHFLIASSVEELKKFAQLARWGAQTGYPVVVQPFGNEQDKTVHLRCENEADLVKCSEQAFAVAWFGYVAVCKSWGTPREAPLSGEKSERRT